MARTTVVDRYPTSYPANELDQWRQEQASQGHGTYLTSESIDAVLAASDAKIPGDLRSPLRALEGSTLLTCLNDRSMR